MTTRDWKFLVWKSTATSLSTSLVDFTVDNAHLASVPILTGSRVRPLEGRTEARPWTIEVLDSSSFFTSQIGDGSGRVDLLNRFVQGRLSIDGGAYTPVGGGRLVDAINADNIATWQVTVQDEWLAGANTMLFTTNTTLLYPPRPYRGYKGYGTGGFALGTATRITGAASATFTKRRLWLVSLHNSVQPLTNAAVDFIRSDLLSTGTGLSTSGSFRFLRLRVGGVDYKVVGFKTVGSVGFGQVGAPDPENHLFDDDALTAHQTKGSPLNLWVAASSTAFGGSASKTFTLTDAVSLHAMTAPASVATPLHIWPGWSSASPYGTIHPMQVLKDVVDGVYSSSSEALPYYSTESFTGTKDVRRLPTVGVAFRLTQPAVLRDWVTDNLLAPHGMCAVGDSRGKVAFIPILSANPQLGYSTSGMYSFTSTNLRAPHPDWRTSRREQVTQAQVTYERVTLPGNGGAVGQIAGPFTVPPNGYTLGGDGLAVKSATTTFNHDRIQRYGTFPVPYNFSGYGDYSEPNVVMPSWVTSMQYWAGQFVGRVFQRYGDGPIQGTLYALPGASTVAPGDFVKLSLASFPNPAGSGARGGTRLVQILTKDITPEGYAFEYLDAGGSSTPATPNPSPTVTLSTSTASPKHALRATVSGGIPSGGYVALFMAESATTTPPGSSNAAWHPVYTSAPYGFVKTTGTYTLPKLKSNTRFFVKGQAIGGRRPDSVYSSPVTKVTQAITSPSGLAMSSVKAQTAGSTWVVGDAGYPLLWHLDTSTTATPSTQNQIARLPAGTAKFLTANLTPSQKYRSWIRHADPYGGVSGFDSTTFTMTSTATTSNVRKAPPLGGIYSVFAST